MKKHLIPQGNVGKNHQDSLEDLRAIKNKLHTYGLSKSTFDCIDDVLKALLKGYA